MTWAVVHDRQRANALNKIASFPDVEAIDHCTPQGSDIGTSLERMGSMASKRPDAHARTIDSGSYHACRSYSPAFVSADGNILSISLPY